jgi:hypothetical protein
VLSSTLAAVTARSPPARLCPRAPAEPICRPLGSLSRSSRRRSVSAGDSRVRSDRVDMVGGLGSKWTRRVCMGAVGKCQLRGAAVVKGYSHNAVSSHVSHEYNCGEGESPSRMALTVGKKPSVKTLSRLVLPQAPSPMMTSFLDGRTCQRGCTGPPSSEGLPPSRTRSGTSALGELGKLTCG